MEDFLVGNNSRHWANTTVDIHHVTRSVYQCCNGFYLGADGKMAVNTTNENGNQWAQKALVANGKKVYINIDPAENPSAKPPVFASDICAAALARKEEYAAELIQIAANESLSGYITDWEDAVGNDVGCFNALWGYVAAAFKPHNLTISASVDDSGMQGPMSNSTKGPWSVETNWIGYVAWAGVLVNMGTYPGPWSQGLSFPAAQYLESTPCPKYPAKECGLKGQVLNFLSKGTSAATGQLSPGLMPQVCSPDGSKTANGWTKAALQSFLAFLDVHGVRTVTLWFPNALQLYSDSFTCPWFMPEVLAWAERP